MLTISVKVRRGSGPIEESTEGLVVFTLEKREHNRANLDIVRQLAHHYGVGTSRIRLIKGQASTNKVFRIEK